MDIPAKEIQEALQNATQAIARTEEAWREQTAAVAARLLSDPGARILLLAGPSSSGKTKIGRASCRERVSLCV